MSSTFGASYSAAYDSLYRDKDYEGECALIRRILDKYCEQPITRILDLGCGSGNHLVPLARSGFRVTGVDRSGAMVAEARRKLESEALYASLECADIRTWQAGQTFDAGLMMFAVLGYQLGNEDVLAALATARKHLKPGGLLLFDVWYGPAVLTQKPDEREKVVEAPDGTITRSAKGVLDTARHLCHVEFRIRHEHPGRPVEEFEETHDVRYFFPLELELFLEVSGFRLLRLGAFPEFEQDPSSSTWNVLAVAQVAQTVSPAALTRA